MQAIIEHILKSCAVKDCGFRPEKGSETIVCFGCEKFPKTNLSMLVSIEEETLTERIQFVGDKTQRHYAGDHLEMNVGDIARVSQSHKIRLLKDHPNWFAEPGKPVIPKAKKAKKAKTKTAKKGYKK